MRGDRVWPCVWLLLAGAGRGEAESVPKDGVLDPRIRTALYSSEQVYKLYGFVGFALDLEFEVGESFEGLSAGDPEAITYSAHDHVLTLRPRAASSHMNVAVSTNKRRYYLDYTILAREPLVDEVMYAIRFRYPPAGAPGSANSLSPAEQVELEMARAQLLRSKNYDYWFCGNPAVRPIAASDDGVHTRLKFESRGELPAIFVRNDDESESLINFSMQDGEVIIHRVARRFVLRRGALTGCIVNKGCFGTGEWLKSGTVAPDVQRERKGFEP